MPTEAAFALKLLVEGLGGTVECRTDGAALPAGNRAGYAGTATIADIDGAQGIVLVGTNPRVEAPVLNARLRKAWLRGASIALVGEAVDLTYPYEHLGTGRRGARRGWSASERGDDVKAAPTLVIVGQGALTGERRRGGARAVMRRSATASQSRLLVLHTAASRVGRDGSRLRDRGRHRGGARGAEVVYNLGADEMDMPAGPFVVYQGSHGDRGAHRADVILPGAAWVEEPGIFVNTEGRPQMANRAGFPPGEARENWAILRALSAALGQTLPFDSLAALQGGDVRGGAASRGDRRGAGKRVDAARGGRYVRGGDFRSAVAQHYLANPIARASEVMAELTRLADARIRPMAAE